MTSPPHHAEPPAPSPEPPRRRGLALVAYGAVAYVVGGGALTALSLVMLGVLAPDGGPLHVDPPAAAVALDVALLAAFGLQHSVMARPGFKARWTRIIPPAAERSTYVLVTGLVLAPVLLLWQPLPDVVWSIGSPLARHLTTAVAVAGWVYLYVSTFAIDHLELMGLAQVWHAFRGTTAAATPFQERWMYRFDRHPIMTGLLVGLWVTPTMTVGHLVFAAAATGYVIVGVHLEERALRRQWGDAYLAYRRRVRSLVPTFGPR